jgi:predicted TIM-barrel fold metal-dependent hydrolase
MTSGREIFDDPKIDCHHHILDPVHFPYGAGTPYRPSTQEIGTREQFAEVMATYGVTHSLIVGPNSGYGTDNSYLLDTLARGEARFRGIAVAPNDTSREALAKLKAQGIVGIAFNTTVNGVAYYGDTAPLLKRLTDLDMFLQLQVEGDQLAELSPVIDASPVRLLIDHCGRPILQNGLSQPGFQKLLALGRSGRAVVKISGFQKFSREIYPFADTVPCVRALVDAFGLENCVWGSDWPYLKATERLDYGPMLMLVQRLFPDPAERQKLLWDTPRRLFGFA